MAKAVQQGKKKEKEKNEETRDDDDTGVESNKVRGQGSGISVNLEGTVKTCGHSLDDLDIN